MPASAFKAVRRAAADALLVARLSHHVADGLAPQHVLPQLLAAAAAAPAAPAAGHDTAPAAGATAASTKRSRSAPRRLQKQQEPSPTPTPAPAPAPVLRVLCRTPQQVTAALQLPWLQELVLDFLEVHGLKEAVAAVREAGRTAVVALPRIIKPDESRLLLFYLRLQADALLLRGAGPLQQLLQLGGPGALVPDQRKGDVLIPRLEGDFSLNAANALSADLLLRSGLSRLCPTHDLNAAQLERLAHGLGPRAVQLEAVLHQHLPIFHTEHCVFAR